MEQYKNTDATFCIFCFCSVNTICFTNSFFRFTKAFVQNICNGGRPQETCVINGTPLLCFVNWRRLKIEHERNALETDHMSEMFMMLYLLEEYRPCWHLKMSTESIFLTQLYIIATNVSKAALSSVTEDRNNLIFVSKKKIDSVHTCITVYVFNALSVSCIYTQKNRKTNVFLSSVTHLFL